MIREPDLSLAGVMKYIKGPDFPGGGQIITPRAEMKEAYADRARLGARARALDDRAPRPRPVAAGRDRAAARRVGAQGAGGDRRDHQPSAEAGQEVAHAGADARKAARALAARAGARRVRPVASGPAGVRAAHLEDRRGGVRELPAREDEPGDERADQPGDGRARRPADREEPAGRDRGVARVPVRHRHAAHEAPARARARPDPRSRRADDRPPERGQGDQDHPQRRRPQGGPHQGVQAERAPGRRHPRDPAAPAGEARAHPDRAGARGAQEGTQGPREDPRQQEGARGAGYGRDRGGRQELRRQAAHP